MPPEIVSVSPRSQCNLNQRMELTGGSENCCLDHIDEERCLRGER